MLIRPRPNITTQRLKTLALDFTRSDLRLDARITFSRASNATYFDSTGTLQTAGSGVARANQYQDHNPSTLAPLGFLIEEARTNLFLSSADMRSSAAGNPVAAWGNTNITITPDVIESPDGTVNADQLVTNSAGAALSQTTQAFAAGSALTITVFAKKRNSNFVRFEVAGLVNCWFNISTGATATNSAGSGNVLFSAKSIKALPNGWYRLRLTVTTTTITTANILIFATETDGNTSSIGSDAYLFGGNAEVGLFETSYIATTTAAATRLADSASITGAAFTALWNQSEGTLLVQSDQYVTGTADSFAAVEAGDGTNNEVIQIGNQFGATNFQMLVNDGGVGQFTALQAAQTASIKRALAYKVNDFASSVGGAAAVTDTSGTVPTPTALGIGMRPSGSGQINGHLQSLTIYRKRLTNAQIQTLTA